MKHKHHKEIIAWANGAEIQVRSTLNSKWCDCKDNNPSWNPEYEYRVKPKEPRTFYASINLKKRDVVGYMYNNIKAANRYLSPGRTVIKVVEVINDEIERLQYDGDEEQHF